MNGSNAGFSATELQRRAFQAAAAQAIDQHAGVLTELATDLVKLQDAVRVTREFLADLSVRMDGLVQRVAVLEAE